MPVTYKDQKDILEKLNIQELNSMQEESQNAILANTEIVLLSPTGTGKTLAFLLPIIKELEVDCNEIQVLILVPSRELAIQIEQVIREMGTGYKANAVYGGRAGYQDKIDLKHRPAILIGTPGRIADHIRRGIFPTEFIQTLILDEFDKSLEIGFEPDMKEIIASLLKLRKKILTSATKMTDIPKFVGLRHPLTINYLGDKISQLSVKTIVASSRDKMDTLVSTLLKIGNQPGIIFCNFKDTIQEVSDFLKRNDVDHGCFFGGMEQKDRERALIKFRNGTHQLIVATDLAARGIDVPEIKFIIHYQLPHSNKEFTHRNGRTARMNKDGVAYVLHWEKEKLPEFIQSESQPITIEAIEDIVGSTGLDWKTLYVSGGRRDKISKGDIAGFFLKQGELNKDQLGIIEIKQDSAFVAVDSTQVKRVVQMTNNTKLKKKKIRVSIL